MNPETKKKKVHALVVSQSEISPGIFDLRLQCALAYDARPGTFVGVYIPGNDLLLPRPVSICDASGDMLRLVYRVAGDGTGRLSALSENDSVDLIGILGNGFPLDKAAGRDVVLLGGGIGIPPMVYLMRVLGRDLSGTPGAPRSVCAVLGYRNADAFLSAECAAYGKTLIATEDGSRGIRGTVLDALKKEKIAADMICSCGPKPMLSAVKKAAPAGEIYLSLEERMACGVGVCLGCVCETADTDPHSMVHNARVCTEGSVFEASRVIM